MTSAAAATSSVFDWTATECDRIALETTPGLVLSGARSLLCTVFAKNTRHVAAWEDENENDYVDLLAEVDENAGNEHDYATSDIAAQFDHEITVRGASSGTEKVVSRTIDFILGDDYAAAAFRFCVNNYMFHNIHVRSFKLKIKEEIDKMPEEDRPPIGSA